MSDRHLWYAACVIKSKCLNFGELVEVAERNKDGPVPFSVALGIISVYLKKLRLKKIVFKLGHTCSLSIKLIGSFAVKIALL